MWRASAGALFCRSRARHPLLRPRNSAQPHRPASVWIKTDDWVNYIVAMGMLNIQSNTATGLEIRRNKENLPQEHLLLVLPDDFDGVPENDGGPCADHFVTATERVSGTLFTRQGHVDGDIWPEDLLYVTAFPEDGDEEWPCIRLASMVGASVPTSKLAALEPADAIARIGRQLMWAQVDEWQALSEQALFSAPCFEHTTVGELAAALAASPLVQEGERVSFTLGAEGPPVDGAERMDSGLFDQGPVYVAIGAREERLAVNAGYPLSSYSGAVSAVARHPNGPQVELKNSVFGAIFGGIGGLFR